ncbi:MAG: hypothetical protein FK733_07240 [Asgard group archaeon]|nr:hypothetical protein [Asgard group archaeon]
MIKLGKKKRNRYYAFFIACCIFLMCSYPKIKSSSSSVGTYTLQYGGYIYFYWDVIYGPPAKVIWSFTSENSLVNIEVRLYDNDKFAAFQAAGSGFFYDVYSGVNSQASGVYELPKDDEWCVVFIHNDYSSRFSESSVTAKVDLSVYGLINWPYYFVVITLLSKVIFNVVTLIIILVYFRRRIKREKIKQELI